MLLTLFKLNRLFPVSGFSNEVLCTLVSQGTAKLLNVKVGGLKKILPLGLICTRRVWAGLESQIYFVSLTLTFDSLAAP